MKLVRYGAIGQEKPGLIDKSGQLRDLSAHVKDLNGEAYSPASLAKLAGLDPAKLPAVGGKPRLGAPVDRHLEIRRHRPELCRSRQGNRQSDPDRADLLPEGQHRLCGPNDPVEKPRGSTKLDWEVEIAAIIGTRAKYVSEADALNHVAGYCVCNDVSERNFQIERLGQWTKGKSHDTFGPLGPWLVTKDEIADVQKLSMWLDVNGKRRQTGSTSTMIFTHGEVHFLRLAVPDAAARRHHHHGHAARRRHRHEAAEIPQCRRRRHARHRGTRRAAAERAPMSRRPQKPTISMPLPTASNTFQPTFPGASEENATLCVYATAKMPSSTLPTPFQQGVCSNPPYPSSCWLAGRLALLGLQPQGASFLLAGILTTPDRRPGTSEPASKGRISSSHQHQPPGRTRRRLLVSRDPPASADAALRFPIATSAPLVRSMPPIICAKWERPSVSAKK